MSDQNQFDQYKQKLLHYWGLFLAACGRFWEKVKASSKKTAAWLQRNTKDLTGKLSVLFSRAGQWLKKTWDVIRCKCQHLLQILAAWLAKVKQKAAVLFSRVGAWIGEKTKGLRKTAPGKTGEADAEPTRLTAPADHAEAADAPETGADPRKQPVANEPAWKSHPAVVKAGAVFGVIAVGAKFVAKWICKLYKVFMAIPVVWMAVKFAMQNMDRLPEKVGLDIQSTGEFARIISRQQAVFWPLGITMFCLVLMFCAKKPILPWVISIFTLVLPWLIWLLNYYA